MQPFLVLRQPWWIRLVSSTLLVLTGLVLAAAGLDAGGVWRLLGPAAGVALGVTAGRTWRLSVLTTSTGLTIRNHLRTHRCSWEETDRVLGDQDVVVLRLRGGREITVSAFSLPGGALPSVARRNREAARLLRSVVSQRRRR